MVGSVHQMIIVVMGVAGSGKTTIGRLLAEQLGWEFIDGDYLHPQANVDKMREGLALTEHDRKPWLSRMEQLIEEKSENGESTILAASALQRSHRDLFRAAGGDVRFVYLEGDFEQIQVRLRQRPDHFFDPVLLMSQFEILEPPASAVVLDVAMKPDDIVDKIRKELGV